MLLFATMYFVQGIAEPTEGLIAQPVRSLLKSWGHSAGEIAAFGAWLALPWSLKPLYGLLTDFVPLAGTRRRSYLILTSGVTFLGLSYLFVFPPASGQSSLLLCVLFAPTLAVAFSDVVVDALMVEKGQPRGLTGRLQSVQWAAMYAATIIAGFVGGYLSQHGRQVLGFLICGVFSLVTFVLAWAFVREERAPPRESGFAAAARELRRVVRTPAVLTAAAFILLWNFNPFSTTVLYVYMTEELNLSEQFYGATVSVLSVGAIAGSLAYGAYCRRAPLRWLIHLSILAGVLATLAYAGLAGRTSAMAISFVVGFTYMTGWLVQLDLAAQACPIGAAGTTFALLMALSNLSYSLSAAIGGTLYDRWKAAWGAGSAFDLLVALGALATCACWLIVPLLHSFNRAPNGPREGEPG